MNNLVQFIQIFIMNYNFKPLLLIYIKLKKTLLFVLILFFINATHSQTNINGSFTVFGEMGNFGNLQLGADAQVFFQNGSTLHMLGTATTINSGAEIFGNNTSALTGTGRILFEGAAAQTLDGGNSSAIGGAQPSLINVVIDNSDNLTLINTNTRITSGLDFVNGHVILGNNNLEFSDIATATNANGTRHVVTNGTGFLAKEGFTSAFSFPVGIATSDFTPAVITPSAIDDFFVQVKDYRESASDEVTSDDGIDRTWNIYSTTGVGAGISLQHNSGSNGGYYISNGGDAAAFVTQYQGIQWVPYIGNQGVWEQGVGFQGAVSPGVHARSYTATATTPTANGAFFSKSTLPLTPLPITLIDFNAHAASHLVSQITWTTTNEFNNSHFVLETSLDRTNWIKIGEVRGAGTSSQVHHYAFKHVDAKLGVNFYRLTMVDFEGNTTQSEVKTVDFRSGLNPTVQIYPNPSQGIVNVHSENTGVTYTLTSFDGKLILGNDVKQSGLQSIDLNHLDNGIYLLNVKSFYQTQTYKIILNK